MAPLKFTQNGEYAILINPYQISTYRYYIILDHNYLFKSKKAFILTDKTKTKKINTVIYKPNLYYHVESRGKNMLIYLDDKVSIV